MAYKRLPSSEWPATPSRFFFIYDNPQTDKPFSYHASPVAVASSSATCVVTCASPCPNGAIPTQTITHISGSSWAGEHTIEGAATSWGCNLGSGSDDVMVDQYGECFYTTAKEGNKISGGGMSTPVNSCFVQQRSALVLITTHQDQWYSVERPYQKPMNPKDLWSTQQLEVKSVCAAVTTASSSQTTGLSASTTSIPLSATAADSRQTSQSKESHPGATSTPAAPPNGSAGLPLSRALLLASALLGTILSL
ncbi:hypothetical protein JDV02_007908 [Purpureocillium takamizusanense]|uniref:Uncharacterized protein n=1 Tax=Purpureocillium takamizusanense TaxID=2060973 RepID=A0A9Q8QLL8_9HYPO|nr:uncharacterized protein JDV02_007908 [Purpureocillium takamizusanense]UNI21970.1 hypothetical protein JDV02_007908 [Purpureocillium takamizusanense]